MMNSECEAIPVPVLPIEGRHVLHVFYRLDRLTWDALDARRKADGKAGFLEVVRKIRALPDTQLLLFSAVGAKADCGFMLVIPDLQILDRSAKELEHSFLPGLLEPVFSYLSMTERSEYTTTEEEFAASLEKEEGLTPGTPQMEERLQSFRDRMAKYGKDRLYPNLPDWPVACFYPMSKRRNPGQNWYALPLEERRELMKGHARVGRTYAGRVSQLITGSTGLDDEEWFVTLFAKTTSEIKSIVYEMRFDPVSAHYADFGEFYIGLQLSPEELMERLLP